MGVFINLSNHPISGWSEKQLNAAKEYGDIMDMQFPEIDPGAAEDDISALADKYYGMIKEYADPVVMVQGEFTFTYAVVKRLHKAGITAVSSCSRRIAEEKLMPDGTSAKKSVFEFAGFRKYEA